MTSRRGLYSLVCGSPFAVLAEDGQGVSIFGLVLVVTRAHCVRNAERAPLGAGPWGLTSGVDGARSTSPPAAVIPRALDELVQRASPPASCHRLTFAGKGAR